MLFLEEILSPHSGELEGHTIHHVLGGYLGLEAKSTINVVASFVLFIEYPTSSTYHNVFCELGEVRGDICLGLG